MSKWANRLKSAMAKIEILEVCLDSSLTITDKTQFEVVSSVFVSGQFRDCSKNDTLRRDENPFEKINLCLNPALTKTDETQEIKFQNTELENLTITTRLNRMIAAGVKFEVSADDFQTFGASERETAFLRDNQAEVLCTLQQGLLQKHLFQHTPEKLEVFTVEVYERSAIISEGKPGTLFEAVCEVTSNWITKQIEKL